MTRAYVRERHSTPLASTLSPLYLVGDKYPTPTPFAALRAIWGAFSIAPGRGHPWRCTLGAPRTSATPITAPRWPVERPGALSGTGTTPGHLSTFYGPYSASADAPMFDRDDVPRIDQRQSGRPFTRADQRKRSDRSVSSLARVCLRVGAGARRRACTYICKHMCTCRWARVRVCGRAHLCASSQG